MKKLYHFFWDCERDGELEGVFLATAEEIASLIGKFIYFGECLGKHSEISGVIQSHDIRLLTDDQEFIAKAELYGLTSIGYNPLSYIEKEGR